MATSTRTRESTSTKVPTSNTGPVLIWLDDSSEEDPNVKAILSTFFNNVLTFTKPDACLDLVESVDSETSCLSILISGKYGQMLARDRFQPLEQVKDIYVFCYDTVKHGRWAQTCDKVRCVFSDITKIIQCMQYDIQDNVEQPMADVDEQQQQEQDEPQQEEQQQRERYTDDNNLFDQLALNLLLQGSDDGAEDFLNYCRSHDVEKAADADGEDRIDENEQQYFKPEQSVEEWYRPSLVFTDINSNNLMRIWTLRWFIRIFHRQLVNAQEKFIKDNVKLTVSHGACLTESELDGMKHRIGQTITFTELLLTYRDRQKALESIATDENLTHNVVFEIDIDATTRGTVPYAEVKKDEVLLWFGGRYRLTKIEYIEDQNEQQNAYWLVGLNLCSTLDFKPPLRTLYDYYLKELTELNDTHHAFGRILLYKGRYAQAEQWLQTDNHYAELAEVAIRQSRYQQAQQYLEHLPEDSFDANLLRAYLCTLTSNDNLSKARAILLKILSEATDKLVRARANLVLGFINLITTQQVDQAHEHFTLGNEVLRQLLPDIHPNIAKSLLGIGYTYYTLHKLDDAKKHFQMALTLQKQSLSYNHPDIAKTRSGLAHCLSNNKQTTNQASTELEYALSILSDTFSHEQQYHPEIQATKTDIEKVRNGKVLRPRGTLLDYI